MSISKKLIHQPLSEPVPKLPVTHRVLGPAFSDLTNPAIVEVKNSQNDGFSLAQILDASNSELLVKFIDPLIKQSAQVWVRSDQVRPQPPMVSNDDVEYLEGEYLQIFSEQTPFRGWWNAKVISSNHPFYLVEWNNTQQIVHFNSTRKCNILSIQPLFSQLFHDQIIIPSHLLNIWRQHGPPNFKMITQSSGALQIRDIFTQVQGKVVVLGKEQSISQAKFLIQAAFDHFQEIYQKEEENKIAFPSPSLEEIEEDQFLLHRHDQDDGDKIQKGSKISQNDQDIDSQSSSAISQYENRIKYSEFIQPGQIAIKYQGIFDRCSPTSKKYKGQFIVPQNLVGLVIGKQKTKIDSIRKRQQIIGVYYDALYELGDDKVQFQKRDANKKKTRSSTLFTVFGINKQCVKTAVQEMYLIQHDIPLEVEICRYLITQKKLATFKQKSNAQKVTIDYNVYLSQDDVKYQNLNIIGSPKSVKNCKAIVQMFIQIQRAQIKAFSEAQQREQLSSRKVTTGDKIIDISRDQPILSIQNLTENRKCDDNDDGSSNSSNKLPSPHQPQESQNRSSTPYSEIDTINHDFDRQNLGRNYSYHSHYRGGGQTKINKNYNHNNNNNNNYWNKFSSRGGGVGGGGGYDNRRYSTSNMYKGQIDRSSNNLHAQQRGVGGKFKYVKKE